jgi:hypothetical protein
MRVPYLRVLAHQLSPGPTGAGPPLADGGVEDAALADDVYAITSTRSATQRRHADEQREHRDDHTDLVPHPPPNSQTPCSAA